MKTILVSMLQEHGHLNPSFKVNRELRARGYDVKYLGIADFESHIRAQGFDYVPFFPDLFPRGFIQEQDRLSSYAYRRALTARFLELSQRLLAPQFRREIEKLAPAAMIIDINQTYLAMFAHMMGIPKVAMNVTLPQTKDRGIPPIREGTPFREGLAGLFTSELSWQKFLVQRRISAKLAGLAGLAPQFELTTRVAPRFGVPREMLDTDTVYMPRLIGMHELILCPDAFDFERPPDRERHFVESIDLVRKEVEFPWDRVDPHKPLIYIAMGSQRFQPKHVPRFLRAAIEAVGRRPQWQAIVALGRHLAVEDVTAPPNVIAVKSAPQLAVLQRAKLMVTHGGLGSVKECITYGVPMIVFPLAVDQPGNAVRVAYHRIGLAGDVRKASSDDVLAMIERVLAEPEFFSRISAMRERFAETERGHAGADVVESVIASKSRERGLNTATSSAQAH